MNDSGLTNRLPFLPAKKESWADPELSIGTFCGAANGKLRYWEAQGPAQEAYGRICTNIQDILNGSCGPVRCSSAIVYDIYMIGRAPATAVPHIMFSCKQRKSRKQAVSAVRASGILNGCPGFELGHWEYPPHIANIRLLADTSDGDSVCSSYSLTPIFDALDPSSTLALRLQETNCMANNPMAPRIATIGSTVKHNGQLFYVAPRHVFFNDEDLQQRPNNNAVPRRSKGDCEFGAFPDDDDVTDEEADFMSQYNSDRSSESDSDSDFAVRTSSSLRRGFKRKAQTQPFTTSEDARSKRLPCTVVPVLELDAVEHILQAPTAASKDLDYALLEANPHAHNATTLPVLSRNTVGRIPSGTTDVTAVTGFGNFLHGRISGRPSYVRIPGAEKFQQAFSVTFADPIAPGDCGSLVCDQETGRIYGTFVLGSVESRVAYIIPATDILEDLKVRYDRQVYSESAISRPIQPVDCAQVLMRHNEEPNGVTVLPSTEGSSSANYDALAFTTPQAGNLVILDSALDEMDICDDVDFDDRWLESIEHDANHILLIFPQEEACYELSSTVMWHTRDKHVSDANSCRSWHHEDTPVEDLEAACFKYEITASNLVALVVRGILAILGVLSRRLIKDLAPSPQSTYKLPNADNFVPDAATFDYSDTLIVCTIPIMVAMTTGSTERAGAQSQPHQETSKPCNECIIVQRCAFCITHDYRAGGTFRRHIATVYRHRALRIFHWCIGYFYPIPKRYKCDICGRKASLCHIQGVEMICSPVGRHLDPYPWSGIQHCTAAFTSSHNEADTGTDERAGTRV